MSGFDNDVLYADNVDFTGSSLVSGQMSQNGQLLVGSSVAPNIRSYVPTGNNGVSVTTGEGTLDFALSNVPNSALQNSTITLNSGTNISVAGSPASLGGAASVSVVGPPSATSLTNHGVVIGQSTSAVTATSAGTSGQLLQSGGASADPNWTTATFPSTAGSSGNVLTSDGTNWTSSAASGGLLVQTATITLTSAQLKAINTTPIQVIAAQGAGKVIQPIAVVTKFTYGGTNVFTGGAQLLLQYSTTGNTNVIGNFCTTFTQSSNQYNFSTITTTFTVIPSANCENSNLYVSSSANWTGNAANDNTVKLVITYYVQTIA